jgi:beta-galactosidase
MLDDLARVPWSRGAATTGAGPTFFRGELKVDEPADAFLGLRTWSKGYAWVNGFCLGRYWERGPHRSLYVPAPLLRRGANEVVVLEFHPTLDRGRCMSVGIVASHDYD